MITAGIVVALFGACLAQLPQQAPVPRPIAILSQSNDFSIGGAFNYGFQAENGIVSSATGSIRTLGPKDQAQVVQGSFSYIAPDGTPVSQRYYADETGYHVEGSHLPTPPPVPSAIARSLQNAAPRQAQYQPSQ